MTEDEMEDVLTPTGARDIQEVLEKAKAIWRVIREHASPFSSAWEFENFRPGVDGEALWRAMDEVLGEGGLPE